MRKSSWVFILGLSKAVKRSIIACIALGLACSAGAESETWSFSGVVDSVFNNVFTEQERTANNIPETTFGNDFIGQTFTGTLVFNNSVADTHAGSDIGAYNGAIISLSVEFENGDFLSILEAGSAKNAIIADNRGPDSPHSDGWFANTGFSQDLDTNIEIGPDRLAEFRLRVQPEDSDFLPDTEIPDPETIPVWEPNRFGTPSFWLNINSYPTTYRQASIGGTLTNLSTTVAPVPIPSAAALGLLGLGSMAAFRKLRGKL